MSETEQQSRNVSARFEPESAGETPAVVGVGVGAASLRSLEALFGGFERGLGAAFVVAVRQQEGLNVDSVVEVLQRRSPLAVSVGKDGERIEPDHIYVGGPNDMIGIEEGRLVVRAASEPVGHRGVIDSLFISMAEAARERSVAVLLGGLGSDGTAGVTATKECGGLSIAEVQAGEEGAAPPVVGPSGVVDVHLPADEIEPRVASYLESLRLQEPIDDGDLPEHVEAQVTQITTILRNVTSHDFHGYKRGTFLRRVQRRIQVLQIDDLDAYIERLRENRDEVQDLFQDLLIGVTQFFRDQREFEVLEGEIPRLFEGKGPEDQLRVWVLGCATGEEAYSIAILLREHMATLNHPPQVQIFATDLDSRALGLARAGRYAETIADHVRPDRLDRWFIREGNTYCVAKELREMCIFSPHNVIKDAPFSRIDILSCRNLLIYLSVDLQNRVMPIFHFSLRSGGVLFLGSSENVTRHQRLFAPIDRRSRVFRRLETATRVIPDFPLTARARVPEVQPYPSEMPPAARLSGPISRQADAVAERYAPAYVVVDRQYDVLHFSGRTGRFLEPSTGAASLNLLNLVHRDLRIELRSALHRAISESARVELPRMTQRQDDRAYNVNVIVEPLGGSEITSLVVVFQDAGQVPEGSTSGGPGETDEHIQRLEAELRLTRDRLQATIEELESTNEELKSSNEEYQSINEELQSANEEMETSKEELQSVNEELQTVNGELGHRVTELGRSNSDLANLLTATQIATVFLDNDMRVRTFTPSATEVFHLLETDVGRPIGHVVSRVAYPGLQDDLRAVSKTLMTIERSVVDPTSGRHYAVKVLPYRSVDNYISGTVVTFTDLTAIHEAESALRKNEERLQALLAAGSEIVYRMSADWTEMIELSGGGSLADPRSSEQWLSQHVPAAEQAFVGAAIADAIREKRTFELEHRVVRADGTIGWAMSRAVPLTGGDGEILEWFGAASDITSRREAEEALRESEERLHSLVEGLPQLVWRAVGQGAWSWVSPQWTSYTGQSGDEALAFGWLDAVHLDDRDAAREAWNQAAEQDGFQVEYRIRRAVDDTHRWFQTRATPVRDEGGAVTEWIGTSTDINDLRDLQERQKVLVAELQHRTRNLIGVVSQMAQRTARTSVDLQDFQARFRSRLNALARVQGLLSRLNEHDRVTFDELIRAELSAHGMEDGRMESVTLDGPSGVRLRSTTVQTLAMGVHELTTNAVKYGALQQPGAHLTIAWRVEAGEEGGQPWLHVDWRETGVTMPPPAAGPTSGGQGRELIERALPYQLSARTTYVLDADGVHCTISVPVSASNNLEP